MSPHDKYLAKLREIIGPTEDLYFLDLCCGECTHTRELKFATHYGVDLIDWPKRPSRIGFEQLDVTKWPGPKMFHDVALCSDGIEHMTKRDGLRLLLNMLRWARLPIIFTPMGRYLVDERATDPHTHKSGWTADEFRAMGWKAEEFPFWHPTLNLGAFFAWKP